MRSDLERARKKWLKEAKDDEAERRRREKTDFLTYRNEDGLFADFHSHRHAFISSLGRAGVPLTVAQKLARHSTSSLTTNVYTHLELTDRAAAIESLPSPPAGNQNDPEAPPSERIRSHGRAIRLSPACQEFRRG